MWWKCDFGFIHLCSPDQRRESGMKYYLYQLLWVFNICIPASDDLILAKIYMFMSGVIYRRIKWTNSTAWNISSHKFLPECFVLKSTLRRRCWAGVWRIEWGSQILRSVVGRLLQMWMFVRWKCLVELMFRDEVPQMFLEKQCTRQCRGKHSTVVKCHQPTKDSSVYKRYYEKVKYNVPDEFEWKIENGQKFEILWTFLEVQKNCDIKSRPPKLNSEHVRGLTVRLFICTCIQSDRIMIGSSPMKDNDVHVQNQGQGSSDLCRQTMLHRKEDIVRWPGQSRLSDCDWLDSHPFEIKMYVDHPRW